MMKNEKIKYVVFDLDQTIINHLKGEKTGLKKIFDVFLKDHVESFQQLDDDFTRINTALWVNLEKGDYDASFIINNRFKYLTRLYGLYEQVDDIQKVYTDQYIEHCTLFGGAKLLLDELYKIDVPMAIGSNGYVGCQTRKLNLHGLKKYFSKYYFGNKAPFCKPHQHFFKYIVKDLGVKAKEILFIGDSEKNDIYPAIESGMKALHINQQYMDGENLVYEKILAYIKSMAYAN